MAAETTPLRVVIDTNIVIRGLLSPTGASALLVQAIRRRGCLLIASRASLSEIHRVLCRPRFERRYGVTRSRRQRLVVRLYTLALLVEPVGHLALCRDPKDDYLIEMALAGQAAYLVSEDSDLHDDPGIIALLLQYGIQLVHVSDFARLLTPM